MIRLAGARPTFGDFLRLVDVRTKIVSVSSLLVGSGWALATAPDRFSWELFALMAAATLLIDMGTTGFNSYFDFVTGVDTRESDVERSKALVQSRIDPRIALYLSCALFAAAIAPGLAIGARAGWGVVATGAACMVFAFFYSGGPRPFSRTPVGEFFAGGLLGGVLIATSAYVHTQRLDAATILVGIPSSLLIAAILSTNNACDRVGDERAGRRTLAIVLGSARSHWPVFALVAASHGAVAVLAALRLLPALGLPADARFGGDRVALACRDGRPRLDARDQGREHGQHLARLRRLHRVPAREPGARSLTGSTNHEDHRDRGGGEVADDDQHEGKIQAAARTLRPGPGRNRESRARARGVRVDG